MADIDRLSRALKNAHAAGDVEAARTLAQALRQAQAQADTGPARYIGETRGADTWANALGNTVDSLTSGIVPGSDEITALESAVLGRQPGGGTFDLFNYDQPFGERYDAALEAERAQQRQFNEEAPLKDLGGEIVGGVGGAVAGLRGLGAMTQAPGAVGRGASAAYRWLFNPQTMAGTVGRAGAAGAGAGAAFGFGEGEGGFADRAQSAATGGLVGGTVGGAAPPVATAVRGVAGRALQTLRGLAGFQQATPAQRKVAEALVRDGFEPEEAVQRLQQLGPEGMILDLGPNSQGLARAAATIPGEGKAQITDRLVARQEGVRNPTTRALEGGQNARVEQGIDGLVPERYRGTMDDLTRTRSAAGGRAYGEAMQAAPVWSPRLQQFFDDPIARQGLARGLKLQRLEALAENRPFDPSDLAIVDFDEAGAPILGKVPNMRTIQAVKEGIDQMLNEYRDKVTGRLPRTKDVIALENVQRAFLREVDGLNPEFAAARAAWADPSAKMDATNAGLDFLRGQAFRNDEELARYLGTLSDEQRHYFRVGAVQALRDQLGGMVPRADVTKRLFEVPALERKLRLAFNDEGTFRRYVDLMERERAMFDSYANVTRGSRTAVVDAEQADAGVDPGALLQGAVDIAGAAGTGSPMAALNSLGRGVGNVYRGVTSRAQMNAPMSRELAAILTGNDIGFLASSIPQAQLTQRQRALIDLLGAGVLGQQAGTAGTP